MASASQRPVDPITSDTADQIDAAFAKQNRAKRLGKTAGDDGKKPKAAKGAAEAPAGVPSALAQAAALPFQAAAQVASAAPAVASAAGSVATTAARVAFTTPDLSPTNVFSDEQSRKAAAEKKAAAERRINAAAMIHDYYRKFPATQLKVAGTAAAKRWSSQDTQEELDIELARIRKERNTADTDGSAEAMVMMILQGIAMLAVPKEHDGYGILPAHWAPVIGLVMKDKAYYQDELTEMGIELRDWFSAGWMGRLARKLFLSAVKADRMLKDPHMRAELERMRQAAASQAKAGNAPQAP